MLLLSICLAVACVAALLLFLRKPARTAPPPFRARDFVAVESATPPASSLLPGNDAAAAELAGLQWIRAETLPEARLQAITAVFRHVPRPPRLLQQLISPDFVNNAGLEELAELISSEPQVAAKVLATANSPMFGLSTPVTGLPQAISTLGLITLRTLCLRYIMIKSFQADSPERQTLITNIWNATSLASELSLKLSQALRRPEPGRLATLVVLSFLGRLATTATMPRSLLATIAVDSFVDRTRQEQLSLGLSSAEVGALLMRDWNLPASLIDEVREVDRTLVLPDQQLDLALCYLCARLGKRLASGELRRLDDFDLAEDDDPDFHMIRTRLVDPAWQAMAVALRQPALSDSMQQMAEALRSDAAVTA